MERILDVVDENSYDNSLRAIYFRMISEDITLLRGEKGGFRATLEAIDSPFESYLEARMIIEEKLYRARLNVRPVGTLEWDIEPDANAEVLLRLYTIQRKREITYK